MKKLLTLLFLGFFFLYVGNLCASPVPIEVLSSSSHIWGWYNIVDQGMTYSDSYDISSTVPLTGDIRHVDSTGFGVHATSSTGFFSVGAAASAMGIMPPWGHARSFAEAEWTFRPLYDSTANLVLDYMDSWYGGKETASLKDLTDGTTTLWNTVFYGGDHFIQVTFNADHVYDLYLSSLSGTPAGDGQFAYINLWNGSNPFGLLIGKDFLQPIPEPATLLLLGLGLIGLAGVRRKFSN